MQPLEVKDFSGGMTDNYLAGPANRGQLFDNLLINNNGKPFTRFGSVLRDTTAYQTPNGNKRISHMWDHRDQIIEQSERNIYYEASSTYNTLLGPTGNPGLDVCAETDHISKAIWNNHSLIVGDSFLTPVKIFRNTNSTGTIKLITAGLPAVTAPSVVSSGGAGSNYIYAFLYYNTYDVEGVTFEDFGPTVEVSLSNAGAPNVSTVNITNIPVIANGVTGNYDTTVIKVKIYRTQNNGTVLTYIGQVTNGTTVYNDSATDASIVNAVQIYTTGDVVDNDPPPLAKYVHVANDIAYYVGVKESGIYYPNRVRQSIKGDIDSCPESFNDDYPDELMGVSSIQSTFIVFGKNSVYRSEGFFDLQGRGGMSHLKISDTFGAISNDAIIQVDDGIIFASLEGWCYTDGYKVQRISNHLNRLTYPALVATAAQARNMWGAYDKVGNRVWFAAQKSEASLDNDACYILDLHWGIKEESTFTSASNGESFNPTCLLFKDNYMYRSHNKGFVFKHSDAYFSDPNVDLTTLGSTWAKKTIIHDYKSCAFDFGTSFIRKFVNQILVTLANVTNIAIQVISNNDDGKKIAPLTEIRHYSSVVWGDPEIVWGDATVRWNISGLIEAIRKFPSKGLRCNYKQIQITNSLTIIGNSDLYSTGVLDTTAKTLTFTNTNSVWPTDVVGYYISFVGDGYVNKFLVTARNSATQVTVLDALSLLPVSGTYKWELKGYRKDEYMNLLSYVLHYKMLTPSQRQFHASTDTGGNA